MGKTRILIVDDDRSMVKTISDILTVFDFDVLQAYSGEEGLERVKADAPDCVLMDIKMPGMNGNEALKLMKEQSPHIPVILMSAYPTEEIVAECKEQGASAVLTKPINIEMIVQLLGLLRKEESILIVDDDPSFCTTLKDILGMKGYAVTAETEPDRVLGHMEEDYRLAVLLDLKLGERDGVETLREIRKKYPTKPVVLVTGYRDEVSDSIQRGLEAGAYTCMYKPLEIEELLDTIRRISTKKLDDIFAEKLEE